MGGLGYYGEFLGVILGRNLHFYVNNGGRPFCWYLRLYVCGGMRLMGSRRRWNARYATREESNC